MTTASFGSVAAAVSAANGLLAKNRHSLVSTANAVASAPNFTPYRVPTAGAISTMPTAFP